MPREHAPGHPYGVQAGPGGMYALWCLRDDCDWRDTTSPQQPDRTPTVTTTPASAPTDTGVVELDDDLRAVVSRLLELQEQRQTLDAEEKALKADVRRRLTVGQRGAVDGRPVIAVQPNRRFQPALAAQVLPAELLELCKVTVVDSKAAKSVLPPALYDQCMAEVGEPVVRAL